MESNELIKLLTGPFLTDYAQTIAPLVRRAEDVALLYRTVVRPPAALSAAGRHKVRFRGSYVLEKIYFDTPALFEPHAGPFCRQDFAACTDPSARRHFAKIMAHLLDRHMPPDDELERIAAAAAEWAVEPQSKVSVRVWAVEVLRACRGRVGWVEEVWEDLLETLAADATPGIDARMRRCWRTRAAK